MQELLQRQVFEAAKMDSLIICRPPAPSSLLPLSTFLRQTCRPPPPPPPPTIRLRVSSRRWLNPQFTSPRLVSYKSRRSITNSQVCGHVSTEEEVEVDEVTNCAIPVVNLKSDLLESEPLNLLAEDTYVDTLLTTLPVLSEEELNALAATPAHPAGLYALYGSCLVGNLVEQLWNFAWPAAIALLHPSLLPVAVMGFFSKLAVIIGGPLVGKLMDHLPRVPAYNCLTIVQVSAQLVSVGMIIRALTLHSSSSSSSMLPHPWFIVLVFAGAIERLSGLTLGVAMERDWVVMLAGTNRPIALAQANAILSRIDFLCEIAGASLFGIFLAKYDHVTCLKLAASLMIGALPIVVVLTWLTNKLSAGVLDRAKCPLACCKSSDVQNDENIVKLGVEAIKHGWVEYMRQPVLPASLAYVLLYCNVVLVPGGLMTAFLTQRGLNPSIIGAFSGLCAFMGVAATFVSANLVKRLGVLKAGAAGLIFQVLMLTGAVAVYWSGSLSQQTPILLFLCLIVLSRLGQMSYDAVGKQILQTGIPSSKANLIATTEMSIASLAESVMLGVAIIANDVSHFGVLAVLSLLSVAVASWLFCRLLVFPEMEGKKEANLVLSSFDYRCP